MQYVIDDTPIIEADVLVKQPPLISSEVLVPIIDRPIEPNSIIIPAPEILSVSSTLIEVSQSFQCDVDYYGGVGIEQNGDVDAKLVKNPNTMTAIFTGLSQDTEYTIKGVGLPILGNETISEGLVVRTKASPIPDDYQLVEYLESNGTQYINTNLVLGGDSYRRIELMFFNLSYMFGQFAGVSNSDYVNQTSDDLIQLTYDGQHVNISYQIRNRRVIVERNVNYIWYDGYYYNGFSYNHYTNGYPDWLFGLGTSSPRNLGSGRIYRYSAKIIASSDSFDRDMYPVYRKSDSKPGMYDIVNNVFYTNQGTGEFIVGPDKEWEN